MTTNRFAGEVVKLTRDCDLGQEGERAVVVKVESSGWAEATYMTLCFFDRDPGQRSVNTGADYRFLRSC
ncbi:MAG TPA: hypothetical protein VLE97_11000 [Gaiellaceae bacterium]|nr:hypothetical protein [Gaiellaceae bacterium]